MGFFSRGRYRVRMAQNAADVTAAQRLRHLCFIKGREAAPRESALDADHLDPSCDHILIEDSETGALACCFRLLPLESGAEVDRSYSAQYYDLAALRAFPARMVEMGRFCIHPEHRNPDVLRIAWGAMTRYVDERGIELLFGCSSFEGVDAEAYRDAFALLRERHLAPKRWLPRVKAPRVFRYAAALARNRPDPKRGMKLMPPLLRGYLSLGGWVSDHAVIDHDLNTLHVFTGVEIKHVPDRMARLLRGA